MKENVKQLEVDELEINIKRIIEVCLLKIKWIIAVALAFALLISIAKYVIELYSYNSNKGDFSNEHVELTEEDYRAITQYKILSTRVEQLNEYCQKAAVMKIDFNNAYKAELQLYVNTDKEKKYDVACLIKNYIDERNFLLEKSGLEDMAFYGYELFAAEISDDIEGVASGVINVRIWAAEEEACKQYVQLLVSSVMDYSQELGTVASECKIEVLEENYAYGHIESVYEIQRNIIYALDEAVNQLRSFEQTMTQNQREALNGAGGNNDIVVEKPVFSKKLFVLGGIIGAIAVVGTLCIWVVFGGKLQTVQEIYKRFGMDYLGSLRKNKQNLFVAKMLNQDIDNAEKQVELLCARLISYLQANEIRRVAIIGTSDLDSINQIKDVVACLSVKGVACELLGDLVHSTKEFSCIVDETAVVLVEQIGVSKITKIYEEVRVCNSIKAQILGYVTVM